MRKGQIKKNEVGKENYHTVQYLETFSDDQFCKKTKQKKTTNHKWKVRIWKMTPLKPYLVVYPLGENCYILLSILVLFLKNA